MLLGHVCDLSDKNRFVRERLFDGKLCIVSSHTAVYIPETAKEVFFFREINCIRRTRSQIYYPIVATRVISESPSSDVTKLVKIRIR